MGLHRELRIRSADAPLDLAGNDYLGLSKHPEVRAGAIRAVEAWGAGATGSRLVSGTTQLHLQLEQELAHFHGAEAALVFSSGYAANLGAVTALCGPDTLIVADKHIHASLVDALRLTNAEVKTVKHNNVNAVEHALANNIRTRALVVIESIYSVDGDSAPLSNLVEVARRFNAGLIVDDAHGFGVVGERGEGLVAASKFANSPDVVTTVTLSKALGSLGGAVLGSKKVIEHLINSARSFIFDTGLAPAAVGAALSALSILRKEPDLAKLARRNALQIANSLEQAGFEVQSPSGAVVSVKAPSAQAAVSWAQACRDNGVQVGCFRPPSVPDRVSRLRITANSSLTAPDIEKVVAVVAAAGSH